MKKFIFAILLLLLILGGVFYQQIIATIEFYQYQSEHKALFERATLTWKPIPFTSTRNSIEADQSLSAGSLQFPIPFPASVTTGRNLTLALGAGQSIRVATTSWSADFLAAQKLTDTERKDACTFLSRSSGRGACTSNYDFYRAFLEFNNTDIHAFASISDKHIYNRLMTFRADAIPSRTVSGFETSRLRGFLFTIDSGNYVAELFDQQDQQFHLEFNNVTQAEVAFVLSNLSSTN